MVFVPLGLYFCILVARGSCSTHGMHGRVSSGTPPTAPPHSSREAPQRFGLCILSRVQVLRETPGPGGARCTLGFLRPLNLHEHGKPEAAVPRAWLGSGGQTNSSDAQPPPSRGRRSSPLPAKQNSPAEHAHIPPPSQDADVQEGSIFNAACIRVSPQSCAAQREKQT